MHFELTHQALSTILLDAIQFYPVYNQAKEAYGILLGTEEVENSIAEYTFPVGNVERRDRSSVTENREISNLIKNARKIVATSTTVASYHSHPFDAVYNDWARPSNSDCFCVISQEVKAELIIAIAKIHKEEQPLTLRYKTGDGIAFIPNFDADGDPIEKNLKRKVQYIQGSFGRYEFEIRAYLNTTESLEDLDLFSSEVGLNKLLRENELSIEQLPNEAMYSVRKIEYAGRQRTARNTNDKIQYHINKIKRMELLPLLPKGMRKIDGKSYLERESISYVEAILLARKNQLYIDVFEDSPVLFRACFDEKASVLFIEDLEKQVGSTIDLEEYMVEAGYIEQISLGNIERFQLRFWILEDAIC